MGENSFYYRLAVLSSCCSIFCLLFVAVSIPTLFFKAQNEYLTAEQSASLFKEDTDRVWQQLQKIVRNGVPSATADQPGVLFFSRRKRDYYGTTTCSGCNMLSCPLGMAGPAGPPGDDGIPGMPGNPGQAGNDGYDVELAPEDDLPCSICPAGPPGPRGPQGERGMPGYPGMRGETGLPGNPGVDGPLGYLGLPGDDGLPGDLGNPGVSGETVIAGVGIPGPIGPAGPQGMKGKPGPSGRAAKEMGAPGSPGFSGPSGPMGIVGRPGESGPNGPPGDPGMPASYCPSDCGVSHIMMPSFGDRQSADSYHDRKLPSSSYGFWVI